MKTLSAALLTLSLIGTAAQGATTLSGEQKSAVLSVKANVAARSLDVQKMGLTGKGVTVAIIDTGIDSTHPDLAGAVIAEACFSTTAVCPNGETRQIGRGAARDDSGHGTHIAGIIAGRGHIAPLGLAPNARIVAIRIADGKGVTSTSAMIAALNYILEARPDVQVVNMSIGTTTSYPGVCDAASTVTTAFAKVGHALRSRGVLIVAAAGNDGLTRKIAAPACVTGYLSVGAVHAKRGSIRVNGCTDLKTRTDRVACFSNSSASLDLLAPGAGIVAARLGGGAQNRSGTSQAAAVVSGAIALLMEGAPSSGRRIDAALLASGASITDRRNGQVTPRLDTRAALTALRMN